jgi:phage-related baseplate assembly protein
MPRFFNIDLSTIPPPDIVETLSFETLRSDIINDCTARLNAAGIPFNVQTLESDPFVYLCEAYAARELQLRARVNDACKAVLLASSWGTNLDNIGATFATPRNPGETDAAYKARIHQAPDAFAAAGPLGGYEYWANTLVPGMLDVSAVMTSPGTVQVTLLAPGPTYQPTSQQIQALAAYFMRDDAKPLTDVVIVTGPAVVETQISAVLTILPGPAQNVVLAAASTALANVISANQKLGYTLARSAIIAALQQPGVVSVNLTSPAADITVGPTSVWNVTSTTVTSVTATSP